VIANRTAYAVRFRSARFSPNAASARSDAAQSLEWIGPLWRGPVRWVRQQLPQVQTGADLVVPVGAVAATRFDDAGVRDVGLGVARDVNNAAALQREAVRHGRYVHDVDDERATVL
jgi:hypothetical protein